MPRITALLRTHNDGLRLGRCLETLYPCDEIVIVDHGSFDGTVEVAREYGARIITNEAGNLPCEYLRLIKCEWVLFLDPRESLSESLAASLYEWRMEAQVANTLAFSVFLREETAAGWIRTTAAQTRLVPANWTRWQGKFPASEPSAILLEGDILRFAMP